MKRASLWKGWYLQTANDSRQFVMHHLPAIANNYVHVWELVELLVVDEDVIPQCLLHQIGDQIRCLIHYSNKAPVAQLRNSGAVPLELSTMKNKADSPPADDDVQPSPPKRRQRESSLPLPPSTLPSSLKASELNDTSVNKLAAIEHCLWLLQQEGPPLSEVKLIALAESLGLRFVCVMQLIPTSISL
jgi:hypothetical protein